MKVPRALIGKPVEVTWLDPVSSGGRERLERITRGRSSLAYWKEYGVIYDVTEGVVILAHSLGWSPGDPDPDEATHTKIIDDLITEIKVLQPLVEPAP